MTRLLRLCMLLLLVSMLFSNISVGTAMTEDQIFISQIGFRPQEPKFFLLNQKAKKFKLIREGNKRKKVFSGRIEGPIKDRSTGLVFWRGDFSKFKTPGIYRVMIDNHQTSESFTIGSGVWHDAQRLVLRSYYLQRCGTKIDDPESKIQHDTCHLDDGILRYTDEFFDEEEELECRGGWHDAGDYSKYISPASISISVLLLAYELYPEAFANDNTAIPESGNGIPDLLDEVRWKLEWMLKMQRPDGGVYHKIGSFTWPGMVLPEEDPTEPRFIYGVSSSATAKFVATMAFASRIYRPIDAAFAETLLEAAEYSWEFLQSSSFMPVPKGSDNSGSGQYGDDSITDDLFNASTELYLSTNKKTYKEYLSTNIPTICKTPNYTDGSLIALFHYAVSHDDEPADSMKKLIQARANTLVKYSSLSAFGITLMKGDFKWASNRTLMGNSINLLLADLIEPNKELLRVAYQQLHYIFGQNPLAKSYVTGLGSNPVKNPHQRLFWSTGIVVPGQMSGGPNENAESGIEPPDLGALSYMDETQSYSSNEYAIDYNANLLFVLASAY